MWAEKNVSYSIRVHLEDFKRLRIIRRRYKQETGRRLRFEPIEERLCAARKYLIQTRIRRTLPDELTVEDWARVYAIVLGYGTKQLKECGGIRLTDVSERTWWPTQQCRCGAKNSKVQQDITPMGNLTFVCPICKQPKRRFVKDDEDKIIPKKRKFKKK